MDTAKRETLKVLGALGLAPLFPNVTVELITEPRIPNEEYLNQVGLTLKMCWKSLNAGDYVGTDEILNSHIPTVSRLITVSSPFQSNAAYLGVQLCIMKFCIYQQSLDYAACSRYCSIIEKYATFANDPTVLAIAQKWQATIYSGFFHQPSRAIPILLKALSNVKDSDLLRSSIYSNLSRSYAQCIEEGNFESKAREYSILAHNTFPTIPTLDPYYQQIAMSKAELHQFDGAMYLNLSKSTGNTKYGETAYEIFNGVNTNNTMNPHYSATLLIKNANVSSTLGYKDVCINSLLQGFTVANEINSIQKLNDLNTVIRNIPKEWKNDPAIQELQHEIGKTLTPLIVARR